MAAHAESGNGMGGSRRPGRRVCSRCRFWQRWRGWMGGRLDPLRSAGGESEAFVSAVAHDRSLGVLAAAEVDGFGFRGIELDGSEVGALVASIAERLVCA